MTIRPSVPEIITVNSEDLQTVIRDLLPSQNGFGSELQASNVITPIIDLTPTAEGSTLRSDLQTALSFGGITSFDVVNTTTTLINSPGFYRIFGVSDLRGATGSDTSNSFDLTDGLSTKQVWQHNVYQGSTTTNSAIIYDFVVWLSAGDSISGTSNSTRGNLTGSTRQIADSTGTLVQPSGYPL